MSRLTNILIDQGRLFYDINLKTNGAIVISQFFNKFAWVLMTYVKNTWQAGIFSWTFSQIGATLSPLMDDANKKTQIGAQEC